MPLRLGDELPSIAGASTWLNTEDGGAPKSPTFPLLVHFWAVSCYLCKDNYPTLRELKTRYAAQGLNVIAVHMPRQEEDTDLNRVKELVASLCLTEPCAVDNEHALKDAFKNEQGWVPAYFLFDSEGKLKIRAAGEAGIRLLQGGLERMFAAPVAA